MIAELQARSLMARFQASYLIKDSGLNQTKLNLEKQPKSPYIDYKVRTRVLFI